MIDSHCHLDHVDLTPYQNNFNQLLDAIDAAGVKRMLCVCIKLSEFENLQALVKPHRQIDLSLGQHPLDDEPLDLTQFQSLASSANIVAIGETGLDYYYGEAAQHQRQRENFKQHLILANSLSLPIIIHTRDAQADTLSLIKTYLPEKKGVLHCFSEDWPMAKAALEMGFYISFSGIITFKNAESLREVVKQVPLERILIETDSPYLAPVPYRGKKNEPTYLPAIAAMVAELKQCSLERIIETSSENYYRLFSAAARSL